MTDRGETGETGRKGDTGRAGDTGRTGDTGDRGAQGIPGVSLTIEQLEHYVRRLEARYRKLARLLTVALVVTAGAGLGTLAWTADGLRDRVESQQADRRAAVMEICQAQNKRSVGLLAFLEEVAPDNLPLGRETFPITDCNAAVRRLAPKR